MATIVNTPGSQDSSGAGWAVAVVVLLLVLIVGYFAYAHYGGRSAAPSANVNVTLPTSGGSDSGGTTGGSGGAPATGGGY